MIVLAAQAFGRLGADPRAIETRTGKARTVGRLAVAVPYRENGAGGEGILWLGVIAFGRVGINRFKANDGARGDELSKLVECLFSARTIRPPGGRRKTSALPGSGSPADSPTDPLAIRTTSWETASFLEGPSPMTASRSGGSPTGGRDPDLWATVPPGAISGSRKMGAIDYLEFPIAKVPDTVTQTLERLADQLRRNPTSFQSVNPTTCTHWQQMLREWIGRNDIPLLVRQGRTRRGSEVTHVSGRRIVVCDNSPAVWACGLALNGVTPSLAAIRSGFARDAIPVGLAMTSQEKAQARFRCMLPRTNVNTAGWKLCHVEAVGMRTRKPLEQIPIPQVQDAFWRLLNPDNYFLLPKSLGGLGEVEAIWRALSDSGATQL